MSYYFGLFFIPFVWCGWKLVTNFPGATVIDSPLDGGRMEGHGFILVFTGLGAALFGREVFDAAQDWRSMRRRRRPKQPRQRINWFLVFGVVFWGLVAFAVVKFFWVSLLVVGPFALYFLALTAVDWYHRRCRRCQRRGLREAGSWKWDAAAADSRVSWGVSTFYLCKHCGARFKQTDSDWTTPTDAEWKLFASKAD